MNSTIAVFRDAYGNERTMEHITKGGKRLISTTNREGINFSGELWLRDVETSQEYKPDSSGEEFRDEHGKSWTREKS